MARDITQNCSMLDKRHLHSVVIDGGHRVGHVVPMHTDGTVNQFWLFRDWHSQHLYDLAYDEMLTMRPYPSAPIPDPD